MGVEWAYDGASFLLWSRWPWFPKLSLAAYHMMAGASRVCRLLCLCEKLLNYNIICAYVLMVPSRMSRSCQAIPSTSQRSTEDMHTKVTVPFFLKYLLIPRQITSFPARLLLGVPARIIWKVMRPMGVHHIWGGTEVDSTSYRFLDVIWHLSSWQAKLIRLSLCCFFCHLWGGSQFMVFKTTGEISHCGTPH